jgi:hypothetical protein
VGLLLALLGLHLLLGGHQPTSPSRAVSAGTRRGAE